MTSYFRTLLVLVGAAVVPLACSSGEDEPSQTRGTAEGGAEPAVERYRAVVVPQGLTWEDARQRAEADGGHLVTIESAEENERVYDLIAENADIWLNIDVTLVIDGEEQPIQVTAGPWIGLYQPPGSPEPDEGWMWVTGQPLEYSNWATEGELVEPSNLGGVEHYGHFFGLGLDHHASTWNDASNDVTEDLSAVGIEIVGEIQNPRGYIVEFEQ